MNYQTPELRRALAADYAIGLMPPTARRRFEHLLQGDALLRVELARWLEHLNLLTEPLIEQPVPGHVWQAIVARIEPQTLHVAFTSGRINITKILSGLCEVIAHYPCDMLLLTGRPSRLPGIQAFIRKMLPQDAGAHREYLSQLAEREPVAVGRSQSL